MKVEQLQFLFQGLQHFKWSLTFIEDEPKEDTPRTIDVMREMMESREFDGVRDQVHFLEYDTDLKEEIGMYKDSEIAQMGGDEFARASVKGGSIQVGLRYLAQVAPDKQHKTPKAAAILYTDCDTSVNLGNSGILLNQIYNPELAHDVGIGSRRIQGAHVVVNIEGELFSIRMGEMSKDQLKSEMVYRYQDGRPFPYKKYSAFMKEMNS